MHGLLSACLPGNNFSIIPLSVILQSEVIKGDNKMESKEKRHRS